MEYLVSCLAWTTSFEAASKVAAEIQFRSWYKLKPEEQVKVVPADAVTPLPDRTLAPPYAKAQYI